MQIKIGTLTYQVKLKPLDQIIGNKSGITLKTDDKYAMGGINVACLEIELAEEMPKDKILNTLWHEIIHGIIYAYGIKNENEEEYCRLMSTILIQLIKDNEKLIEKTLHNEDFK